jgi:hypothetical protein
LANKKLRYTSSEKIEVKFEVYIFKRNNDLRGPKTFLYENICNYTGFRFYLRSIFKNNEITTFSTFEIITDVQFSEVNNSAI